MSEIQLIKRRSGGKCGRAEAGMMEDFQGVAGFIKALFFFSSSLSLWV